MNNKRKKSAHEMTAGDIFHPGEHLKDEIDSRAMSQQELADKAGLSKSEISSIIHGRRNINPLIAIKLEIVLKISAEFWMNLQIKYDIDLLKRKYKKSLAKINTTPAKKAKIRKHIEAA